ncbi:hypothetical protein ACOMHN_046814 [Nucella lapillus]
MASKLKDILTQQLRSPTKGFWGWIASNTLKYQNRVLDKNAPRLCAVEPHHRVLQIGFGEGVGVKHALRYVKDGPGKICGVDLSPYMVEKASARLRKPIREGKVELGLGDVQDLPYGTHSFHCAFHCCCYYLWPSMQDALQELYRILKPGGVMVTMLDLERMHMYQAKGWLQFSHFDPVKYMHALELTGFQGVRIEYLQERSVKYQAIFAHVPSELAGEDDFLDQTDKKGGEGVNDAATSDSHRK